MDIVGKWKYAEMSGSPDSGIEWVPMEQYLAENPDPMFAMMAKQVIEFTPDGMMISRVPKDSVPPDAMEEMEDVEEEDGWLVIEKVPWKEENGEFYMKDENPGTIFDEKAPDWIELPIEDGKINLLCMSRLEKLPD